MSQESRQLLRTAALLVLSMLAGKSGAEPFRDGDRGVLRRLNNARREVLQVHRRFLPHTLPGAEDSLRELGHRRRLGGGGDEAHPRGCRGV